MWKIIGWKNKKRYKDFMYFTYWIIFVSYYKYFAMLKDIFHCLNYTSNISLMPNHKIYLNSFIFRITILRDFLYRSKSHFSVGILKIALKMLTLYSLRSIHSDIYLEYSLKFLKQNAKSFNRYSYYIRKINQTVDYSL